MRKHFIPILFLYFTALAIRFVPLLFSSLPYNIDGFPLVRVSDEIISTGQWTIGEYNTKLPIFGIFVTMASLISSQEPLYFVQVLIPIVTSLSVVIAYVLAYKITRNRIAAIFAGLFLALCGFYVFLTAAVMKQAIGFVLLPVVLFLYSEREDSRKRVLCAFLLLLLPLLHHLTSLIVFAVITLMMVSQNIQWLKDGTWKTTNFMLDVCLGPLLSIFIYWYYVSVDMPFFVEVANVNAVSVFLSVYFVVALLTIYLSSRSKLKPWFLFSHDRKGLFPKLLDQKALFIIGAVLLLALNHYTDIFAGTLKTKTDLLLGAIPYLVLLFLGLAGFNVMRNTETRHRPLVAAAYMGPISVMLFSFLWRLDPISFTLFYRSYDFIDIALAISIGIAVSYIIAKRKKKVGKVGVAAGVISLILLTTPFAYGSVFFFGIENTTYDYEFRSMGFVQEHQLYPFGSDQRIYSTIDWYHGIEGNGYLPYRLSTGMSLDSYDYVLLEDRWKSIGAQSYPSESIRIEESVFESMIQNNNLIYVNAAPWENVYVLELKK